MHVPDGRWKIDYDRGALVEGAFYLNLRAMLLYNMLDDCKAKAGSSGLSGSSFIYPVESFKNTPLVFLWNADSGI